ncbi:MBL fold metallo-hydrolase [Paraconexibacter antarcticus]|uniref:MBL fold metallo-hydrolase n=1 Tax=Paraconexibacter antarcticus TaxID=2949664 RepID=A0ABY5DY44_9ACTN|nr:MBL fold metallo-hydrolase [Paraconexibacter antarcticus]UTI66076.1 MBL fold metallo-hydrolase [Paraconexibacter antarcticus]
MPIDVLARASPAANLALVGTVLVDTGGGVSDNADRVERFLAGRPVELIALTHGHLDHAGGAAELRDRLGAPIALHRADLATLARDAARLHQPLTPFTVDRVLEDGDTLPGGIEVVGVPSQTPGHVAYWVPAERTVLTGDLLQRDDVAWLPPDDGVIDAAIAAIGRLAALRPVRGIPGHGPDVTDVPRAVAATIARYEQWREHPDRQAWHAARRIAAGRLSLEDPRPDLAGATELLAAVPMLADFGAVLGLGAGALAAEVLRQLVGSGALGDDGGPLVTRFPHEPAA